MSSKTKAAAVVARLTAEYHQSVETLRGALKAFMDTGALPDPKLRANRAFTYPKLVLTYRANGPPPKLPRSFARFSQPGVYATTITRPDIFADYLTQQLTLLMDDF